mgnify:CR=1 FL=1
MISNIPEGLRFEVQHDKIRFGLNGITTNWMSQSDGFIKRIDKENINQNLILKHLTKELEIKNTLDQGITYLKTQKYLKAIDMFDEVIFYDDEYGEALLNKSYCLKGQKHFVKSLRYYRKAINADDSLKDIEYYKTLLRKANNERDNFPRLKLNIYAGDEYFSKGEFARAIVSYDKALANPSKFKDKILNKLLNKKANALFKLKDYGEALGCFRKSQEVKLNDYAIFGEALCEYELELEVNEKFKAKLDITKKQMLKQVLILNDLGFYSQSLAICDFLCQNHFKEDEFYFKLIKAREVSING